MFVLLLSFCIYSVLKHLVSCVLVTENKTILTNRQIKNKTNNKKNNNPTKEQKQNKQTKNDKEKKSTVYKVILQLQCEPL